MNNLLSHLTFLYGADRAPQLLERLEQIIREYRPRLSARDVPTRDGDLTERDSILITYGDQVQSPDEKPLQTLSGFCKKYLTNVVSGIHILPFYPWTSDDGFSVVDYRQVDPALGNWEDISSMQSHFRLMFDAVINHMSSHSEWFLGFLSDDPGYRDYFVTVAGSRDLSQVVRPRALPLLTVFDALSGKKSVWTTFSDDQVDLNYKNPEVLLEILDILLMYVERGATFIRLDKDRKEKPMLNRAMTGETVRWEGWATFRVGDRFTQRVYSPHREADGTVSGYFVFVRDITDLKLHERALEQRLEELRKSEAMKAAIINSALDCVIVIDEPWPVSTRPSQEIAIEQIVAGLPMTNALVRFELHGTQLKVAEGHLEMAGGHASIAPADITVNAAGQRMTLKIDQLSVSELFKIAGVAGLSGEGAISGNAPITLFPNGIIVDNAKFAADAPGVLRYDAAQAPARISDTPRLGSCA